MKIEDDILHVSHTLLELTDGSQDIIQTYIYYFLDKQRDPSSPFYKHLQTVSKMATLGLITLISSGKNTKVAGLNLYDLPYYQIQYSCKKLDAYLRKIHNLKPVTVTDTNLSTEQKDLPHCILEGRWGYLQFHKYGEKKKIGNIKSRHLKLIKFLLDPIGGEWTVDAVFNAIKIPKDEKEYINSDRKVEIIKFTIKELQKAKKLKSGKLEIVFEHDDPMTKIRAVIE